MHENNAIYVLLAWLNGAPPTPSKLQTSTKRAVPLSAERTENLRHVKFLQRRIHAGEVLVVASGIVLPDTVQRRCRGCPDHG